MEMSLKSTTDYKISRSNPRKNYDKSTASLSPDGNMGSMPEL
jgi:hypothetical protein